MEDARPRQEIVALQKEAQAGVELYRSRCIVVTTELYQMLMVYTLFQGVLFTAVATAEKLTCQTSLLPALLSLLTSTVTAWGVHSKLNLLEVEKVKHITQEQMSRDWLMLLDENPVGAAITLKQRGSEEMKKRDEDLEKKVADERYSHGWSYGAVMAILCFYSLLLLACCVIPLCWDQDKSTIMLCAFNRCLETSYTLHMRKL